MESVRWGQLSYGSFDAGLGGGGGWQVKQTTGALSELETERVKARVVTSFEPVGPLPQFPTPDEVALLPRRLAYVPLEETGSHAYWHAVPAGTDGTGRPGNVFTHALIDRAIATPEPALRPIDLWRSDIWVSPFGQREVAEATLIEAPTVRGGTAVTAGSVIEFLLDHSAWRTATLSVLLDAFIAARAGGPSVVIATESTDTAAQWVGALMRLMAPSTSRTVGFSVFERASGVAAAVSRGAMVFGVPYADLEEVAKIQGVVLIDDRQAPDIGDLGGEHHRLGEAVIEVTPWSVMAQVALQSRELAALALDRIDAVSAEVAGEPEPAWPLAMTVALLREQLVDASAEAFTVLRDASPTQLRAQGTLWAAVSDLAQSQFGTTSGEAWSQVEASSAESGSVVHDLAVDVYNQRVVEDTQWLLRPSGVPVAMRGDSNGAEATDAGLVAARLALLRSRAEAGEGDHVELLRLVDWAVQSGLGASDDVANEIDAALAAGPISAICDASQAPPLIASVGPIAEATLAGWVRSLVMEEEKAGRAPARFSATVLDWLFPDHAAPADNSQGPLDSLVLQVVINRCATGDVRGRPYRVAVLKSLASSNELSSADRGVLLRHDWPLTSSEAYELESAYPGVMTEGAMEAVLRTAEWDDYLDLLTQQVIRGARVRPFARHLSDLVDLRRQAANVSSTQPLESHMVMPVLQAASRLAFHYGQPVRVAGIGLLCLMATYANAAERRSTFSVPRETLDFVSFNTQGLGPVTLRSAAEAMVDSALVADQDFFYLASVVARARPGSPLAPAPLWAILAAIPAPEQPGGATFLSTIVEAMVPKLGGSLDSALSDALDAIKEECFEYLDPKMGDKGIEEFERFARPVWKHLKSLESTERFGKLGAIGRLIRPNDNDKGRP